MHNHEQRMQDFSRNLLRLENRYIQPFFSCGVGRNATALPRRTRADESSGDRNASINDEVERAHETSHICGNWKYKPKPHGAAHGANRSRAHLGYPAAAHNMRWRRTLGREDGCGG
jgi:hypothetical protein